jgi:hypothetical protein
MVTLTPTMGNPIKEPFESEDLKPLSQAGIYSVGIEPPLILLTNS